MCTYSSFCNAETNWFDWFSLIISVSSILVAWFVSYKIYNRQKTDSEKSDKDLLNQEILFFNKNIKEILPAINHQIKVFEDFPQTNQFNRMLSINTVFMFYFDLRKFYVKIGLQEANKHKLNILNELLISLGSLDNYYEKEKRVYLSLQKITDLAPLINVEKTAVIEKVSLYINSNKYSENQKNILKQYLVLLEKNGIDFKKLNADCDSLTMYNNEASILFKLDYKYRKVRTKFVNSNEDFHNEFEILKSNLKDAKQSIEKYLNF